MTLDELHPRVARLKLEKAQRLIYHLDAARRTLDQLGEDSSVLDEVITNTRKSVDRFEHFANGRIESRRRFKSTIRPQGVHVPEYYLCLDECGSHVPGSAHSNFPVFSLTGVIVSKDDYEAFDVIWKAWKTKHLGSPEIVVHEPEVRGCSANFRRPREEDRQALWNDLEVILKELDFKCIAAVVDMKAFVSNHPHGRVDDFLPESCYLMCIDFIMERFVHFLQHAGNDARGNVIAESRGLVEDAKVHAEFIRLHLEGTQFLSARAFCAQLRPYIEFFVKKRNHSGLQVADLAARPFAEIILNPKSTPARWNVFKEKLYDGLKSAPQSYGLKIFPLMESNDPFINEKS